VLEHYFKIRDEASGAWMDRSWSHDCWCKVLQGSFMVFGLEKFLWNLWGRLLLHGLRH